LDILELERKVTRNWEHGLDRDPILRIVQSRSFSDFFESHSQAPRYLSLFLDFKIRSCVGNTSGVQFEDLMDTVGLVLFNIGTRSISAGGLHHITQFQALKLTE
jgi:hypothetical protein